MRRSVAVAAVAVLALQAGGCATKKDLRLLRDEVVALQARQDSLFQVLQRQNAAVQDSIAATREAMMRLRGDLTHQLVSIGQQLVQLGELAGQSQSGLMALRQEIEQQRQALTEGAAPAGGASGAGPAGGGSAPAAELYRIGSGMLESGSAGTARQAFERLLREHPQDSLAPAAQLKLAESYVLEQNFERGLREFERVVELYPASTSAPQALYRAGVVEQERGNNTRAREYFTRVTTQYRNSEEARRAQERLGRLRR